MNKYIKFLFAVLLTLFTVLVIGFVVLMLISSFVN